MHFSSQLKMITPRVWASKGDVLLEGSQVVFHVKHFHTDIFSNHFHAFIIIPTNTYSVVTLSPLHHALTHHIHRLVSHDGNSQAIVLKYHVSGTLNLSTSILTSVFHCTSCVNCYMNKLIKWHLVMNRKLTESVFG